MFLLRTTFSFVLVVPIAAVALGEEPATPVEAVRPHGWRQMRKPAEARKPLPPVPLLIERLGSPKFAERAAATRDLARSGEAGVAALREAALSDQPEVSIRAVAALENLWLLAMENDDQDVGDVALAALDQLSYTGSKALQTRVDALLGAYTPLIERHALNELRRMGATLKYSESILLTNDDGTSQPSVQHVVIGTKWTGGEDGLRHIRRVRSGTGMLGVYFIDGVELPDGAVDRFKAAAGDDLTITRRGASYLGVQSGMFPIQGIDGCLVTGVEPDTPAAKAGVQPQDVFVRFHDKKISTFQQLVDEIKLTVPGDTIDATVLREGKPIELKITMEEWK